MAIGSRLNNPFTRDKPFKARLKALEIHKIKGGSEVLNVLYQVTEVNVYQSIFSTFLKMEVVIDDSIGIFVNYPLTGEEWLYAEFVDPDERYFKHVFVIDFVKDISFDDRARSVRYVLGLVSRPAFENAKHKVSHAYHGPYSYAARDLFNMYIAEPAKLIPTINRFTGSSDLKFEDIEHSGEGGKTIVVPHMYPMDAIRWLGRKALSATKQHTNYAFYQDVDGFHFKTIQKMIKDWRPRAAADKEPYTFVSDNVLAPQLGIPQHKIINHLHFDKRYSTFEKLHRGYFENGLMELNLLQKAYRTTETKIQDYPGRITSNRAAQERYILNTDKYVEYAYSDHGLPMDRQNPERQNRMTYAFNNRSESEPDYALFTDKDKWGEHIRAISAFDQIDIVITIEGDFNIKPGQLIFCRIPEMHGYNVINDDKFISGNFLVCDVRHKFFSEVNHVTILRLIKDTYEVDLDAQPFKYSTGNEGTTYGIGRR